MIVHRICIVAQDFEEGVIVSLAHTHVSIEVVLARNLVIYADDSVTLIHTLSQVCEIRF